MIICVADNLVEEFYKTKCKDFDCFLKYESVKDNLININVYVPIMII